ncbi:MAG: hypothetical protein AAB385_04065 [Planctomycetota bacterium]|jgi:hypothetical protein
MFLRQYHRTKACPELRRDGKRHTSFALVESHRPQRGLRQRIVAQLGELTADQQRRRQPTAIFHTRHTKGDEGESSKGRELSLFPEEALAVVAGRVRPSEASPPAAAAGSSVPEETPSRGASATDDPDVVRVRLGKVGWTNARAFGDVWLGLQL